MLSPLRPIPWEQFRIFLTSFLVFPFLRFTHCVCVSLSLSFLLLTPREALSLPLRGLSFLPLSPYLYTLSDFFIPRCLSHGAGKPPQKNLNLFVSLCGPDFIQQNHLVLSLASFSFSNTANSHNSNYYRSSEE